MTRRGPATGSYGGRAHPLPPEERRLEIVQTALALVRERHAMPSTREVAAAAGIAEGTLFRAFGTKAALRDAMISAVACPYPYRDGVAALEAGPDLRATLLTVTTLLWERFAEIFETLGPLGLFGPPPHGPHPGCPGRPSEQLAMTQFRDGLRRLVDPHAASLRISQDELIDTLRYLCFAGANRRFTDDRPLQPAWIVDLLLDGALRRPDVPPAVPTTPKGQPC